MSLQHQYQYRWAHLGEWYKSLANDVGHLCGLAAQKRLSQKHTLALDTEMELYFKSKKRLETRSFSFAVLFT